MTAYVEDDATDAQLNNIAESGFEHREPQVVSGSSTNVKDHVVRFKLCGEATRSEVADLRAKLSETAAVTRTTFRDAPRSSSGLTGSVKTISAGDAEPNGTRKCGDYTVRWRNSPRDSKDAVTVTSRSKERVLTMDRSANETLVPIWCGDITADGSIELGTQTYAQGDTCCLTAARVDTLEGDRLLDMRHVNFTGPSPAQLDRTPPLEVVADSDVIAFEDFLPVGGLVQVPIVFALIGGKYVEKTRSYPATIRRNLTYMKGFLETETDENPKSDTVKGFAVAVFAHYALLGEEDAGLDEVDKLVSHDVARWVRDHADEVSRKLDESFAS